MNFVEDRGPMVAYQAAAERIGSVNMGNRRFAQDIEMQRPAGVIQVEQSWSNRWDRH